MLKGTFHQSFRSGVTVLLQQLLIQAAAIDTDTDGNIPRLADLHNSLYPVLTADVSGVDTDLAGAAFRCGNGQLIVKVNIATRGRGLSLQISAKVLAASILGTASRAI